MGKEIGLNRIRNTRNPDEAQLPEPEHILGRLTTLFGTAAALLAVLGLIGLRFGIPELSSLYAGSKTISFSAALIWIMLGSLVAYRSARSLSGPVRITFGIIFSLILFFALIEFPLNIQGSHSPIETFSMQEGTVILGTPTTPISPVAAGLIILVAISLILLVSQSARSKNSQNILNGIGIIGILVTIVSFTFIVSNLFNTNVFSGTQIIPIAFSSAVSAFLMGAALMTAAGPDAVPLRYFTGSSTYSRLLRFFLPLTIVIVILQGFMQIILVSFFKINNAVVIAIGLVLFGLITALVVARISERVSRIIDHGEQKRRRTESKLLETKEYLENLIRHANAPIITWNPDFTITEFNHAFEILTGMTRDQVIGQHLRILFPEETREVSLDHIRSTTTGEQWEVVEIPIRHVSGRVYTVLWNSANIIAPDGKLISTIAQGQDITERKRAEIAFLETNAYLGNLLDYANAPIIVWDPGFRITRFNHAFERMTGRTEHDVLGQYLDILFPETSKKASMDLIQKTLAGERWDAVEIPIRHVSGETRVALWNSANIVDSHGKLVSTIAQGQDITERKRANEAIKISETRYRRLFESSKDGILILNRDTGEIIDSNPFIESLLGYSHAEIMGKPLWDIGPFRDIMTSRIAFGELQTKGYVRYDDIPLETKERRRIEVEFVSNVYPIDHGTVIQCNIRDITDRKVIERQREGLIQELEQKNAELERFTYTVSHDLKSPLITIQGFAGMLEEDLGKNDIVKIKQDLNRITSASGTMEILLHDLLKLSRIGRIVNPPEKVPFTLIAREAAELLEGAIRGRGVDVHIEPEMPVVNADPTRIREALTNLIENAIKFMGDQQHPVIDIGVRNDQATPVFFVRDNGIGIDPRYQKRIFNLFEKLEVKTEGSGAGLAIVKRIIEVHGGRIWVESEGAGTGSTFCFTMPVVK